MSRNLKFFVLSLGLAAATTLCFAQQQLRQIGMVDIPGSPGFESLAFVNGMLLMTHPSASAVDVFDPQRRRVVTQISGIRDPRGVAVDNASGKVYVADAGANAIAVINSTDWKPADSIAVQGTPDGLLLSADGKMLYWSDAVSGTLSLLDLQTRQTTGSVELGGSPSHMVLDADRNQVFVTVQDQREIVAVDPQLKIASRIKLNASQPTGLVYDPRTKCLYVAVRYAVLSINTDTNTEVNRIPAPAGVDMLWLDPESRTVYVAGNGALLMLRADGQRLTLADELKVDVKGHTVAYDSERKVVLLPGGREGRSKLLILRPMAPNTQTEQTQNAEAKVQ